MPSFDVTAEVNWQDLDDAVNQTLKEVQTRFDFKGIKTQIDLNKKEKTLTISTSEAYKISAVQDVFHNKLVKRNVSLFSIDYDDSAVASSGQSGRLKANVVSGISKEKGKEIVAEVKSSGLKVQAQIHDEKVKITGKKRDVLQDAIAHLKGFQNKLKLPLQFDNFRD